MSQVWQDSGKKGMDKISSYHINGLCDRRNDLPKLKPFLTLRDIALFHSDY